MKPAKPILVDCPYCNETKALTRISSGNTFWGRYWSDTKNIFPMLPQISYVQKCHKCGKYFIPARLKARCGEASSELGTLSWEEAKQAFSQFYEIQTDNTTLDTNADSQRWKFMMAPNISSHPENPLNIQGYKSSNGMTPKEYKELALIVVHAYNDYYYFNEDYSYRERQATRQVTDEDKKLFQKCLDWLIRNGDLQDEVKAEFLRESERFDECLEILEALPDDKFVAPMIKEKALAKDPVVFEIKYR